jgi:hypothetical protein
METHLLCRGRRSTGAQQDSREFGLQSDVGRLWLAGCSRGWNLWLYWGIHVGRAYIK